MEADGWRTPTFAAVPVTAAETLGGALLDAKPFGRARRPGIITVGLFLVAVAAAVATWALLNGTNPIHLGNPAV